MMDSLILQGWTKADHADEYEAMLRAEVHPDIHREKGYQGAYLLKRRFGDEVEFITITQFDDMEAVRRFAGEDFTRAVIHPPARKILVRFDERSVHYETVLTAAQVRELAGKSGA